MTLLPRTFSRIQLPSRTWLNGFTRTERPTTTSNRVARLGFQRARWLNGNMRWNYGGPTFFEAPIRTSSDRRFHLRSSTNRRNSNANRQFNAALRVNCLKKPDDPFDCLPRNTVDQNHHADQGIRFSQFYAMSVCSPTRVSIMTGRNAAQHHTTQWIKSEENNHGEFGRQTS